MLKVEKGNVTNELNNLNKMIYTWLQISWTRGNISVQLCCKLLFIMEYNCFTDKTIHKVSYCGHDYKLHLKQTTVVSLKLLL